MCDSVVIHKYGRHYANCQGELEIMLGRLVREDGYADNAFSVEMCLCPIDLASTAKVHGYVATKNDPTTGEYDLFNTHFIKEATR